MSEIEVTAEVSKEVFLLALAAAEAHYAKEADAFREASIFARVHKPTGPFWDRRPTTPKEAEAWYDEQTFEGRDRRRPESRLRQYGKEATKLREALEGAHVLDHIRVDYQTLHWLRNFFPGGEG